MIFRIYSVFLLSFLPLWPAVAQNPQPDQPTTRTALTTPTLRSDDALNRLFQSLFPIQTDGTNYQAVFDNLAQLYSYPLDLNQATRDDLSATLLLTDRQISSLLAYRAAAGNFLAVAELQAVPDFDLTTIQRLRPFVTIRADVLGTDLPTPADHYLLARYERVLERQKGFRETEVTLKRVSTGKKDSIAQLPPRYLGSPNQWYLRYRNGRPGAYSVGFTLEQDPGEPFRWSPATRQYGPDFVSFHAQIQNRGRWRNVVVGDFQQQIGQGLIFSAGFSLGKNAETILTVRRPTLGTRPYTSLTESGYFRGISATYQLMPGLELTLMATRNRRDANMVAGKPATDKAAATEDTVTSLLTSGLHRTSTELVDFRSLLETNLGGHLHFQSMRGQVGLTVLQTTFDTRLQKRDMAYNAYEFVGKQNLVLGLHGGYVWRNINLFGELAQSSGSATNSGGIGAVGGALISVSRQLDIALLARHYDRNFHSFYANAFSESSRTINEKGIYVGVKYSLYRKLTLSGFIDRFTFPGWRYLVDGPSGGFDYLLMATYLPNKRTAFSLIFHDEHKQKNQPGSKITPKELTETTRRNLALTADYAVSPGLTMRSRLQAGTFSYASSTTTSAGFAFMQDVTYERGRFSLNGRVAVFNTSDYDTRQYAYEQDVLYSFSFPAYFDRGFRHYLLARYQCNRHLDVWLRYARTDITNQPDIGSDLDLISVPHKTELTMQVRWRL